MHTIWLPKLQEDGGPKYLALTRALRDAIRAGDLPQGTQLPTVRDLAFRLGVTPGTVSRAYQITTQEGLLEATVGRGTFVAARSPRLGPTEPLFQDRYAALSLGRIDMRSPSLPDVGQVAALQAAMARISTEIGRDWIDYTYQSDEAELRHLVVDWLKLRVLGPILAEDIMLTHGGQSGIGLIFDCCLRGDRPVVLIEDLAYPGFRYAARAARAEVVGIVLDEQGICPDALEVACRRYGAQVLCLTPVAQNPTTARMSPERMAQVVAIARRYDLQIIEDECYSYVEAESPALRALAPERVWHAGSLSKTISAALRFGYVVCPTGMGEAGRLAAQHRFFALSRPVSALVTDLFRSGAAADLRGKVQAEFSERLQVMVNRLGAFDLSWQVGIPFAWLKLPLGWRTYGFMRLAEERGVLLRAADQYAMIDGRAPHAVRLAIPAHIARQEYEAGLAELAYLLPRPPSDMAV
ncbi:PLP-dependent aminotransferase family protein [Cypionkella sp.]|jgi:DNA-binding transcriptional MocR family regulator|uniref:aminotransferase-like domain-containing protein n=1 Tax=Cypionkella sp. TaxID=2811411 RepID=UPI0027466254|nr:PLP-dependent aminotransferase family protein [Cypionkella sp.]